MINLDNNDYFCTCGHLESQHTLSQFTSVSAEIKQSIRGADVAIFTCICVDFTPDNLSYLEKKYYDKSRQQ
jgi:hypothetical protein